MLKVMIGLVAISGNAMAAKLGEDALGGTEAIYTGLLIFVVILLVLFLVLREVVCWYWKINRIVNLLERIAGTSPGTSPSK